MYVIAFSAVKVALDGHDLDVCRWDATEFADPPASSNQSARRTY